MRTTAATRRLEATGFGAILGPYMADDDIYTPEPEPDRVRLVFRVSPEKESALEAAIRTFNALDVALGVKRSKWTQQAVLERFLNKGLDGLWRQIGGPPAPDETEKQFMERIARKYREAEKLAAQERCPSCGQPLQGHKAHKK